MPFVINTSLSADDLDTCRAALSRLAVFYSRATENEKDPNERVLMAAQAKAGADLKAAFYQLKPDVSFDIAKPEVVRLERGLRMLMAFHQSMIKPATPESSKKILRDAIEDAAGVFARVRAWRGLPW